MKIAQIPDSESYYFFSDLTKVVLEDPRIRMFVKQEEEDLFSISLLSTKVAPFVTLETEIPGEFSDNGILLVPQELKRLSFLSRIKVSSASEFKRKLSVVSLFNALGKQNHNDQKVYS